ncbi:putative potassium transport system protein kup [Fluviibacter phosphoraccumulans]|jgi:KUP system potassium uptake protein|nr:putative potassium transport system protein kup [Fluviibacter phosphoraccumulans]
MPSPLIQSEMTHKSLRALALAALGIVFGDIGTSPLYAFEQVFSNGAHSVPISEANILGVLSLFFWSLMMVVTLKYVFFIMRADNHGEGGIMALMALAMSKSEANPKLRIVLLSLGLVGASFFYGDGVITPAISVLSAVEGLALVSPDLKDMVLPGALCILGLLFWSQRRGTGSIGLLFGPVMLIWFVALGALGLWNLWQHPGILVALNPLYALEFLVEHGLLAFFALGAVVLCLTGAEALYADMGHFGPLPIRIVWVGLVLPSLLLNYFGQGALLLNHPEALSNLFYLMAPTALQTPLIVVATVATVIAAQAVISGAFSMTHQAVQLGFLPRLRILQTSAQEMGQVYIPFVNIALAIAVAAVILIFQSSNALGSAYGIAVTGTMLITDFLAIAVAIYVWKWQPLRAVVGASFFILMDAVFFGANTLKLFDGGWFPLMLSIGMILIMTTWHRGISMLEAVGQQMTTPLLEFIANDIDEKTLRIPGSAIYLVSDCHYAPIALQRTMKHFGVVHQTVAILSVRYALTPYVDEASRVNMQLCDKGFLQIRINSGFMETTDIPTILKTHWPESLKIHADTLSYIIKRIAVWPEGSSGMQLWRKKFFRIMYRNGVLPLEIYKLPETDAIALTIPVTI